MKLKVIFLKKKHIYMIVSVLIVLLICIFFITLGKKKNSLSTFNIMSKDKIFKTDLTGDGEEDLLYVKTKKDKYYVQVNTKDKKSIFLEPEKKLDTLGDYYEHWPMRLTLKDINRDNTPEIFIQSCKNDKAIQHVFLWNKETFEDIFCSYNNILGFVDYSTNRTPKFMSGNYKDGKITFDSYMIVGRELRNFNYKYEENFFGKDTIGQFINLMCSMSEAKDSFADSLKDITLNDSSLQKVDEFIREINSKTSKLSFQDGFFKDSKYIKDGQPSEIYWTLNFKGASKDSKDMKNYTLALTLKPCENKTEQISYKIAKVSFSPLK
ncbi:VCBS repeat-containing protein [Haloimpatiens lingqiaonensis]|uniref:VCBS repeat-containing protein n=1 Tax=Haloimpatiens lingqiaonensis TaxID=1380675 RepID=UPI0010FD7210|nr:VCBS repeat-containing protein [Haloimpatiens lingqiaonensis]